MGEYDSLLMWILPSIGGLVLFILTGFFVKIPGYILNQRFCSLGTLTGKSLKEIVAKVGGPQSVSAMGDGTILRQWQATGYHIALLFDKDDICLGIANEIRV